MTVPKLTREQAAIIGVFTGIACGPFSDIHKKAEELLGRPVFTHEMGYKVIWEELQQKARHEFLAICCEGEEHD